MLYCYVIVCFGFFISGFEDNLTCSDIHAMSQGLTEEEKQKRIQSYGPNSIEVPVKPYYALLVEEVSFVLHIMLGTKGVQLYIHVRTHARTHACTHVHTYMYCFN